MLLLCMQSLNMVGFGSALRAGYEGRQHEDDKWMGAVDNKGPCKSVETIELHHWS